MNKPIPDFAVRAIHRRIKPLIGASTLERVLLTKVDFLCLESRLCVSVIKQVFVDLCSASQLVRGDARRFFRDGRLEAWCDLVGLNAWFLREIAVKAGYLPADLAKLTRKGGGHA